MDTAPAGRRYSDTVPDTLELADRAALGVHGIGGTIDPDLLTMWGLIHYAVKRPHLAHWASAETTCDTKLAESFSLLRTASGSTEHLDLESRYREAILSRIDDGLYWDRFNPRRPWRNSYSLDSFYGAGRDEDFSSPAGTARVMRAMLVWLEMGWQPSRMEEMLRSVTAGLRRIAVVKDAYAYYPEKGGWSEPCAYPRSGWLNTDEASGDTDGGEGSIVCMHGHQIYAAARWYALSKDPAALDLATRIARYVMKPKFWGGVPDSRADRTGLLNHLAPSAPDPDCTAGAELGHWFSHGHGRAIALRGILEYAAVTGDDRAAEFVRRAYEFSLSQGIARIGWIDTYPAALDMAEGCYLGDLVGMAIRMSDLGLGDYWDDADAVTRNHLVEQQLTSAAHLRRASENSDKLSWSERAAKPGEVFYAPDTIERTLGVYAGMSKPTSIPNPWVMHCCTGNATQGLYYAWEGTVRETGDKAEVNLFLNRASRLLDVHSYLPYEGKVVLRNKSARRIAVRVPSWVDRRALRVSVSPASTPGAQAATSSLDWLGNRLVFSALSPGDTVTLHFPVKESTASYTVAAHTPAECVYTLTFRASTLVDISPRDTSPTSYPLYERSHMRKDVAPTKTVERFVPDRVIRGW